MKSFMEGKEIIEKGNVLIAEFMGAIVVAPIGHTGRDICFQEQIEGQYVYQRSLLKYHTSWDWLMPVVEKIELLPCPFPVREEYKYKCYFSIDSGFVDLQLVQKHSTETFHPPVDNKQFSAFYSASELHSSKTKIEAVWNIIIAFIQWFNNQSK